MKKIVLVLIIILIPTVVFALTAEESRARAEQLRKETEQIQRSGQPQQQKATPEDFLAKIANRFICNMVDDLQRDPVSTVNGYLNWSKDYERQQQDDEIRRNILREQNQRRIRETFPPRR